MPCCGLPPRARGRTADSKWSWVVCICATIGNMLMFGFAFSFGVYQPVLMDYFGENKEKTSWAGSITIGLILFSGPFAVFLTDRFGHRRVAMTCGFLCAISLTASSFANHLSVLYVSYGVLYGLSGGIILNTCYTVTKMYFIKNWPLAAGLVSAGSGIGILILTPCNEILLEAVEWRNAFRIMSGVVFLICIAATTYDPITSQNTEHILSEEGAELKEKVNSHDTAKDIDSESASNYKMIVLNVEANGLNIQENEEIDDTIQKNNVVEHELSSQETALLQDANHKTTPNREEVIIHEENKNVLEHEMSVKRQMTFKDCCSLFRNVNFVVGLIAVIFAYFGMYSPHIHLVQFAKDLGLSSRQAAQVYVYFSITNIAARVIIGQVINKFKISPFISLQLSEFVCGLSIILLSFANTYGHLVGFGIAYGIGNGCFIVLQVLFFMSVVGPEKGGLALGVVYMISSVAVLSGPPFAGYLADKMGSYVTSFFVIGGIMVFASVFPSILCVRRLLKCDKKLILMVTLW